jgi:uncharacterized Zn finger protein
MEEPKCPSCDARGKDLIALTDSRQHTKDGDALFYIVHCADCGHIYGIIPKGSRKPTLKVPRP